MVTTEAYIAYKISDTEYGIEKYTGETRTVDIEKLKELLIANRAILGYKVCNDKVVEVDTDDRMYLFSSFMSEYNSTDDSDCIALRIEKVLNKFSTRAIIMMQRTYTEIYRAIYSKYKIEVEWVISNAGCQRTIDDVMKALTLKYNWSKGQLFNLKGLINSKAYSYLKTEFIGGIADYSTEFCECFTSALTDAYNSVISK